MHKYKDIEIIENYLEGKLSDQEVKDFDQRLTEDSDFNKLFKDIKILIEGIRFSTRKSVYDQLKIVEEKLPDINLKRSGKQTSIFTPKPSKKVRPLYLKIAAIAAILIGAYFISPISKIVYYNSLYNSNLEFYEGLGDNITRSDNQQESLKSTAFNYYYKKSFSEANEFFNNNKDKTANSLIAHAYTYLKLKDYENAVQLLKNVIENKSPQYDEFFIEQAKWYLAITYLKTGDIEETRILLNQLTSSTNDFTEKSIILLNKIKP